MLSTQSFACMSAWRKFVVDAPPFERKVVGSNQATVAWRNWFLKVSLVLDFDSGRTRAWNFQLHCFIVHCMMGTMARMDTRWYIQRTLQQNIAWYCKLENYDPFHSYTYIMHAMDKSFVCRLEFWILHKFYRKRFSLCIYQICTYVCA
jgi:hypothetical protein